MPAADTSQKDIEILVHTSAPTSKKDDDRHREQALASLAFSPVRRERIASISWAPKERVRRPQSAGLRKELRNERQKKKRPNEDGVKEKSKRESIPGSAGVRKKRESAAGTPATSPSRGFAVEKPNPPALPTPEDEGDNSPPLPPTKVFGQGSTTPPAQERKYASDAESNYGTPIEIPDSIPDSQPAPHAPITPMQLRDYTESSSPENRILPHPSGISFQFRHPPPSALSLPPLSSLPIDLLSESYPTSLCSLQSTIYSPALPVFNPLCPLSSLVPGPYELTYPPPKMDSGVQIVTHNLLGITNKMIGRTPSPSSPQLLDLYNRLKKSQSRRLRDMERGAWYVDLSTWELAKEKIRFWQQLEELVMKGRMGWVNVFLELVEGGGNLVKVYCWGKAAKYIWAALYVATDRRIKNGAKWVDAGGEVVIVI